VSGENAQSRLDLANLRIDRPQEQARRARNPWLPALIGVSLFAAGAGYIAHRIATARLPVVQTAMVTASGGSQPSVLLTASGYIITSHKYITIGTKILGQIVAEPIEEGQHIRKGDILARIDDRDYQAQLRQAIAMHEVADANLRLDQAKADRARNLIRSGTISKDEYETTLSAAEVAEATLKSTAAAVDYAEFMVNQCVIRSPINGVVLRKYREVGDTVNYGGALQAGGGATDIAQLADTDDMRAEMDINETDIAKVAFGTPANVVLDAYPDRKFDAALVKVYPAADRQKGTVKVEVRITQPDLSVIKPEMGAKVSFLDGRPALEGVRVITVPKSAVRAATGGAYVWVVRDGSVHRTAVALGRATETGMEVNQGLRDGDQVVITSSADLSDGERVAVGGAPGE
jgi:RND family efflux transporter MFP subunit